MASALSNFILPKLSNPGPGITLLW